MKKWILILLIIAGVMLTAGIVCAAAGMAMSGGSLESLGENRQYKKVERAVEAAGITSVYVDNSTGRIDIGVSPDEQIHVSYYEGEKFTYTLTTGQGKLSLVRTINSNMWIHFIGIDFGIKDSVRILVPAAQETDLEVINSTGKIVVSGLTALKDVKLTSSTGDIELTSSRVSTLAAGCSTGDISITGVTAGGALTAKASTGRVSLESVTAGGAAELKTTTGKITMTGVTADEAVAQSTTGDIVFQSLDAKSVTLSATTGSVTGSLAGSRNDYSVISSTSTGSNNLPENWGGGARTLNVKTSTGDISVSFAQ